MDLQDDLLSPPPPYSAINPICSPTYSPGFPLPSFESATGLSDADTGCLPAYQGRPTRRFHPYSRPPHPRIDDSSKFYNTIYDEECVLLELPPNVPTSLATCIAPVPIAPDDSNAPASIGSICGVDTGAFAPIVFDPNDEHHRRIIRLRYVIPQFIHTIRLALVRARALPAVDSPLSVASPDQCVINNTPPSIG